LKSSVCISINVSRAFRFSPGFQPGAAAAIAFNLLAAVLVATIPLQNLTCRKYTNSLPILRYL